MIYVAFLMMSGRKKQITCRVNLLCVGVNACSVHYDLENSFRTLNTSKVARLKAERQEVEIDSIGKELLSYLLPECHLK